MNIKELKDDIETVIEKEISDLDDAVDKTHVKTWSIDNNSSKLLYSNAERLLRLWISLSDDESKLAFKGKILSGINLAEIKRYKYGVWPIIQSASQLCFYVAIKIGLIDEALSAFVKRVNHGEQSVLIFDLIKDDLKEFLFLLTRTQLNELHRILEVALVDTDHISKKSSFLKNLLDERIRLLDKKLDKINVEINQDKSNLMRQISDWGFDEKYNALLESVDKYILSEDSTINSGMVNNLRNFMSDFAIELAEKVALQEKEDIPKYEEIKNIQKVGRCRRYLKEKLNLSDGEHNLYDNFIVVLNNSGGHSFSSDKEYFRLARNMVIEMALFLMTKFTRKYPEKSIKKSSKTFLGIKM